MHLTNMEMVKIVGFVIYFYSMFLYLVEMLKEIKDDKPKFFSEWIGFFAVSLGAFFPILNTIVAVIILKIKSNDKEK